MQNRCPAKKIECVVTIGWFWKWANLFLWCCDPQSGFLIQIWICWSKIEKHGENLKPDFSVLPWMTHSHGMTTKIKVCSKLNESLALFQNCREFINRRPAFNFYYNFFFCHLIYGIHIFGNLTPDYLLNRIFFLQQRAYCLIANVNRIPYHLIQTSDLQRS